MDKRSFKEVLTVFLKSLFSRKFLAAIAAAFIAYNAAMGDGVMTQAELMTVLSPILAFIGIEGYADAKSR